MKTARLPPFFATPLSDNVTMKHTTITCQDRLGTNTRRGNGTQRRVIFSQAAAAAAAAAAARALLVLVVAQAYAAALAAALPAVVQHAAQAMGQAGAVSAEETEPAVGLSSAPARKRALF
jgi:hypothetical protein